MINEKTGTDPEAGGEILVTKIRSKWGTKRRVINVEESMPILQVSSLTIGLPPVKKNIYRQKIRPLREDLEIKKQTPLYLATALPPSQ